MKLKITVHGVAYEVDVEVLDAGEGFPTVPAVAPAARKRKTAAPGETDGAPAARPAAAPRASSSGAEAIVSPVAGTVLELRCRAGESVAANQVVVVIEAMKMKTSIVAPRAGAIAELLVAAGDAVKEGQALARYA